jgi:hypothetical protein
MSLNLSKTQLNPSANLARKRSYLFEMMNINGQILHTFFISGSCSNIQLT